MGESVAEATIIRWTKSPGDDIAADETVMEIATDKVDSDVPSPVAGKLVEQLCKENDVVQVGAVIAIIETPGPEKEIPAPPVYNAFHEPQPEAVEPNNPFADEAPERVLHEQPSEAGQPPVENSPPPVPSPSIFEDQRKDVMQPVPFTEHLTQPAKAEEAPKQPGRFYSPLVKSIAAQEGVDIEELDKIPGTGAEGRLTKDDLLAYIENKLQQALRQSIAGNTEPAKPEPEQIIAEQPAIVTPPASDALANTSGPGIEQAKSIPAEPQEAVVASDPPKDISGKPLPDKAPEPMEAVVASDPPKENPVTPSPKPVPEKAAEEPAPVKPSVSVSGGDEIIEMDRMRRLTAEHMVMSKQTSPHVTSFVEADVTNLVKWREKIKAGFEKREGVKITLTPLLLRL